MSATNKPRNTHLLVTHQAPMAFVAKTERGATLRLDGTPDLGGDPSYLRPMEAVLASLASCSGVDVVMILNQQRQPLEGLEIVLEGERADAIPAVYSHIQVTFRITGNIAENKARRAVALSMDKYCSVVKMLSASVNIEYAVSLNGVILASE
jgi:putative redox protein